jgi:hypothetical protein
MRSHLTKWILIGYALSPVLAHATLSIPRYLHYLNAGTQLVAKQPIVIPANADQIPLTNGSVPGAICKLRVREPKPFDRIIPEDHALTVAGTSRGGFSSSRKSSVSTYVQINSRAVDDLVCVSDRGSREMTVDEFEKLLAGDFVLKTSRQPPQVID